MSFNVNKGGSLIPDIFWLVGILMSKRSQLVKESMTYLTLEEEEEHMTADVLLSLLKPVGENWFLLVKIRMQLTFCFCKKK